MHSTPGGGRVRAAGPRRWRALQTAPCAALALRPGGRAAGGRWRRTQRPESRVWLPSGPNWNPWNATQPPRHAVQTRLARERQERGEIAVMRGGAFLSRCPHVPQSTSRRGPLSPHWKEIEDGAGRIGPGGLQEQALLGRGAVWL